MKDLEETMTASDDVPSTTETSTEPNLAPAEQLADLIAKATAEYAVKHYSDAAELYSQATELQAEINGEMALDNADLLYAYGKCLYYLAQQTSSVLGGTAAAAQLSNKKEKKLSRKRKADGSSAILASKETQDQDKSTTSKQNGAGDIIHNVGDVVPEKVVNSDTQTQSDKPFFQITGDENWDDSEDEEDGEQDEEGEEEEEDDFANAYELLDLARVLYLKKLEELQESTLEEADKGKYVASIDLSPDVRDTKRRIADIYDLQAEVSLEGEKYSAAVTDLKACLALKEELEAPESSLLAECHFKLSLALEFSSQTQQRDGDGNPIGELTIDWDIRNEAISQQEKAIDCCKLRISKETKEMETLEAGKEKDKAMAQIEDVQDMVSEMEVRLADLRKPPISVKAETEMKEQMSGLLGSILGASPEEQKAKLAKAAEGATDLTSLIKKKKSKTSNQGDSGFGSSASTPGPEQSTGKRKVEFLETTEELGSGKKAKVEDAEDSGV